MIIGKEHLDSFVEAKSGSNPAFNEAASLESPRTVSMRPANLNYDGPVSRPGIPGYNR